MRQGMKVESFSMNSEFSFDNSSIITTDLKTLPEGSMSQNVDLGPEFRNRLTLALG